jgi:hypothetical protein
VIDIVDITYIPPAVKKRSYERLKSPGFEIPFVGGKLPDSCKNSLIKVQLGRERRSSRDEYVPGNEGCHRRDRHFVTNRIVITDSLCLHQASEVKDHSLKQAIYKYVYTFIVKITECSRNLSITQLVVSSSKCSTP